jgi:hypothetical protein
VILPPLDGILRVLFPAEPAREVVDLLEVVEKEVFFFST